LQQQQRKGVEISTDAAGVATAEVTAAGYAAAGEITAIKQQI
jgi:hypothetical protein